MEDTANRERETPEADLFLSVNKKSTPNFEHPERNEDSIFSNAEKGIAIVCDGMGGESGAKEASTAAIDSVSRSLLQIKNDEEIEKAKAAMEDAFREANEEVMKASPDGGTTATAVKVISNGYTDIAIVGSIGDSVCCLLRDGELTQITEDDGFVSLEPSPTEIRARLDAVRYYKQFKELSQKEQELFRSRNVLYAALGQGGAPHIYSLELKEGDTLLVMSDGPVDNLTGDEFAVLTNANSNNLAEVIVDAAYNESLNRLSEHPWNNAEPDANFRAKADDMSVVEIKVTSQRNSELRLILNGFEREIGTMKHDYGRHIEEKISDFIRDNGMLIKDPVLAKSLIDLHMEAINKNIANSESILFRTSERFDNSMESLFNAAGMNISSDSDLSWIPSKAWRERHKDL